MSVKIDHITLGQALSRSRRKSLKLTVAACAAYSKKDPFVRALIVQTRAIDQLKSELDTIFHGEVSDAEFINLGHPHYPQRDPDHAELDIGISSYRPRTQNRKRRFSKEENVAAHRCLIEIGESLEYAKGLIAEYGSQHRVHMVLKYAKARNIHAGSHVGLSPVSEAEIA